MKEPILPARHFRAMKPPSEVIPTEDAPNVDTAALAANYLLRAFEAVHSFEADLGIANRRVVVDLISEMRRELLAATSPLNSQ